MANEEHLAILRQGVEVWNEWRHKNPNVVIDLSTSDLSQSNFKGVNFINANLVGTDLSEVDLKGANLSMAKFGYVEIGGEAVLMRDEYLEIESETYISNLSYSDLSGADVSQVDFQGVICKQTKFVAAKFNNVELGKIVNINELDLRGAILSKANFSKVSFRGLDLTDTDFSAANVSKLDFQGANLTRANFSRANLNETNLSITQALETNFTAATLTGACIEDWNINSYTNFDNVISDYIYLHQNQQERRPSSGNFEPGEFTKLFQKTLETVDLIFRNGVNWDAFAYSFKKVEVENSGAQVDVQSIEKKGDGVLLVRVSVSPDTDKAKIHSNFMQSYEFAHKALEAQYQARLEDKDKEINRLFYLVNQLSGTPKKVSNYYLPNSQFAGGIVDANTVQSYQIGGDIYNTDNQENPD